jgi:hypothetical protein
MDEGFASRDRQQRSRPPYLIDTFAAALGNMLQGRLFGRTQGP